MSRALAVVLVLACALPARAADSYLLVVSGVPGDQEHAQKFQKWTATLIETAVKKYGVATDHIAYLGEAGDGVAVAPRGRATADNVRKTMADLATHVRPSDDLFVVLIGHGSFDGRQAAFNLPGPDLTAADYAKLLGEVHGRVVFVNTASASGPFVQALAAPGRTIITATRTGGERNETRFGEYFVAALADGAADRDHDGRVSMLEAFDYARAQVERAYQQEGLVLTEHATLDDGNEGRQAAAMYLRAGQPAAGDAAAATDPVLRQLNVEKQTLEDQIAELKLKKGAMPAEVYTQELERLVTALAVKTREIKEREGRK